MKAKHVIFGLLLLALAACSPVEMRHGTSLPTDPSSELAAVDSLLWQRPDSALTLLLSCRDAMIASPNTPDGDSSETHSMRLYNGYYYQLLLAELLYKNDSAQANRTELQQAVAYFDSLMAGADAPRASADNATIAFLDARAHYINGVGYYEQDSLVEACREYLKALETMEEQFGEKELTGKKAKFMVYNYNRLGDIFEGQLLAEPAIICYRQALFYCRREPTSIYGIPVLLYHIGIQYDIINQKDSALFYYDRALANMPNPNNIHYRDIITAKTVLDFNLGFCVDSIIKNLEYVISLTSDNQEKISRYLTLGNILFESKLYGPSRLYLDTVFEQQDDISSKIVAAENLCRMYQIEGDSAKTHYYSSYLASFTMAEIEKKRDVSKINEIFKTYLNQKQEKKAAQEKRNAVLRTVKILIPIALLFAAVIITVIRKKGEKRLINQESEAKKEMEEKAKQHKEAMAAERQAHKMQQAALASKLKKSNETLRELENLVASQNATREEARNQADFSAFKGSPVCSHILEVVGEQNFKPKMDCAIYKDYALYRKQLEALVEAADRHLAQFTVRVQTQYPKLTDDDMRYCCLYLLGLKEADISALMQKAYSTVCERSRKIKGILGTEGELCPALRSLI
jgi:tetratricopeptide (TPR) repeat protein